jgi:hypothetical protein
MLDLPFPDGGVPPAPVIADFLTLCESTFGTLALSKASHLYLIIRILLKVKKLQLSIIRLL